MNRPTKISFNAPQASPLPGHFMASSPLTPKKESKKSFHEAAKECNAVPVSAFTEELHRQIDEHFDGLKNA